MVGRKGTLSPRQFAHAHQFVGRDLSDVAHSRLTASISRTKSFHDGKLLGVDSMVSQPSNHPSGKTNDGGTRSGPRPRRASQGSSLPGTPPVLEKPRPWASPLFALGCRLVTPQGHYRFGNPGFRGYPLGELAAEAYRPFKGPFRETVAPQEAGGGAGQGADSTESG
jgi:hypothetical protein